MYLGRGVQNSVFANKVYEYPATNDTFSSYLLHVCMYAFMCVCMHACLYIRKHDIYITHL
jgi:hypothetical protein